jgi:hypothetical protein
MAHIPEAPVTVLELQESRQSFENLPQIKRKLSGLLRDRSVPPQPAPGDSKAVRSHIPNIYLNKYSSRRNDLLTMVMNDDSNIEYNNIFP